MSFEASLAWLIFLVALLRYKKQASAMQTEPALGLILSTNPAASSVGLFFPKPN